MVSTMNMMIIIITEEIQIITTTTIIMMIITMTMMMISRLMASTTIMVSGAERLDVLPLMVSTMNMMIIIITEEIQSLKVKRQIIKMKKMK